MIGNDRAAVAARSPPRTVVSDPLLSPIDALLIPMGSVAAFVAVVSLALWIDRRTEALPLLVAAWSANTVLYLWGHYVQVSTVAPSWAVVGARLAWTGAILMVPMLVAVIHGLTRARPRPPVMGLLGLVAALGVAAIWST